MEGDDSRRISQLEWRVSDAEQSIKLAAERIKTLEDAQRRAEQTILNLTAIVESLTAEQRATVGSD